MSADAIYNDPRVKAGAAALAQALPFQLMVALARQDPDEAAQVFAGIVIAAQSVEGS